MSHDSLPHAPEHVYLSAISVHTSASIVNWSYRIQENGLINPTNDYDIVAWDVTNILIFQQTHTTSLEYLNGLNVTKTASYLLHWLDSNLQLIV